MGRTFFYLKFENSFSFIFISFSPIKLNLSILFKQSYLPFKKLLGGARCLWGWGNRARLSTGPWLEAGRRPSIPSASLCSQVTALPTLAGIWGLLSGDIGIERGWTLQRLGMKQGAKNKIVRPSSLPYIGFQNTGSLAQAGPLESPLQRSRSGHPRQKDWWQWHLGPRMKKLAHCPATLQRNTWSFQIVV